MTSRQYARFTFLLLIPILSWWASTTAADDNRKAAAATEERELIARLKSDAPPGDKALACKRLAVVGSNEAVPELAQLLPNEQLASWARIALEAIPGPVADEALRKGQESLEGRLLVGTLNSIGVRRDAGAVELLTARLKDANPDVASAAAVALGQIGNQAAAKVLRANLASAPATVRNAVAEGCILCAERSLAAGRDAEAVEIYDEVRKADVPKPRILEATRGAILARKQDGIPLLLEQVRSPDKQLFQIALSTAREFSGDKIDGALAGELDKAPPERAALIIVALADRAATPSLAALVKAAQQGPATVRIAAVTALGKIGDASCLSTLLSAAVESNEQLSQAAKSAIASLSDPNINAEIAARLAKAEGQTYALLLQLVAERRIDAVPAVLKAVEHKDPAVRSAALIALGNTIPAKNLSVLITQATTPKHTEDRQVALQALKAAAIRMPDREACAADLAKALEKTPAGTKPDLLQIVAAVGGTKALQTIGTAAKSSDAALQDMGSRLLGEWPTIDAAPVLLDLAKNGPAEKYQVRALRGYIRIARQFVIPDQQRSEMCQNAFDAAQQSAEQKLVLEVLKRYPNLANLKLAVRATQIAELKDDATLATLAIAQKLGVDNSDVAAQLSGAGLSKVKVAITKAEYGAGSNQKDVTKTLQQLAGDLQLITLPKAKYNDVFGGDPAPNSAKLLKIQYQLNGKSGEATFAENAAIILPMPK